MKTRVESYVHGLNPGRTVTHEQGPRAEMVMIPHGPCLLLLLAPAAAAAAAAAACCLLLLLLLFAADIATGKPTIGRQ